MLYRSGILRYVLYACVAAGLLNGGCGARTAAEGATFAAQSEDTLRYGSGRFVFTDSPGARSRPVNIWYYRPREWRKRDPIVFVMHGNGRAARRYRSTWIAEAERYGFLLLVPEFSRKHYPRTRQYHWGNVVNRSGATTDSARWSFTTIEAIFDAVKERTGSTRSGYSMYGHSAGAQFVHRMLLLMPNARIEKAVVADAGWYTMPTLEEDYPYGLGDLLDGKEWRDRLRAAFAREVPVLLGSADTVNADPQLLKSRRAMEQGEDRLERGDTFFESARRQARELGLPFRWYLITVPGAGHSNRDMAGAAASLLLGRCTLAAAAC